MIRWREVCFRTLYGTIVDLLRIRFMAIAHLLLANQEFVIVRKLMTGCLELEVTKKLSGVVDTSFTQCV